MQSKTNRDSTAFNLAVKAGLAEAVLTPQTGSVVWELGSRWGHIYTSGSKFGVTEYDPDKGFHRVIA